MTKELSDLQPASIEGGGVSPDWTVITQEGFFNGFTGA